MNIKFPLQDDTNKGRLFEVDTLTKNKLKSKLMLLLNTEKGERWYLPDFGVNLRKYLFSPNDNITFTDIVNDIKTNVSKYIPEITINDIKNEEKKLDNKQIILYISYSYQEGNTTVNDRLNIAL